MLTIYFNSFNDKLHSISSFTYDITYFSVYNYQKDFQSHELALDNMKRVASTRFWSLKEYSNHEKYIHFKGEKLENKLVKKHHLHHFTINFYFLVRTMIYLSTQNFLPLSHPFTNCDIFYSKLHIICLQNNNNISK